MLGKRPRATASASDSHNPTTTNWSDNGATTTKGTDLSVVRNGNAPVGGESASYKRLRSETRSGSCSSGSPAVEVGQDTASSTQDKWASKASRYVQAVDDSDHDPPTSVLPTKTQDADIDGMNVGLDISGDVSHQLSVRRRGLVNSDSDTSLDSFAIRDREETDMPLGASPWGTATGKSEVQLDNALETMLSRNVLPDYYITGCTMSVVLYSVLITYFYHGSLSPIENNPFQDERHSEWTYNVDSGERTLVSYDRDRVFKQMSMLSAATFFSSACQTFTKLCYVKAHRQRAVLYCCLVINLISFHAHVNMASGTMPVFENPWGRRMHYARWAEWCSLVFLLMFVMHALDCEDTKEMLFSIGAQTVSVLTGLAASVACLFCARDNGLNSCTNNYSDPYMQMAMFMLFISTVAYCDLFRVLYMRVMRPVDDVNRAQSVLLICWCTVTWTAFVVVYFLGIMNVPFFDHTVESIAYTGVDVLAKFMYTNVLGQAHLVAFSPEQALQAQLMVKQRANEAQRHFLRYVFHEVRVPLNTIRLGLETIEQDEHLNSDTKYVVSCMDEAVTTMSDTLNDVLSYQKIEEGKLELNMAPFDVYSLVESVAVGFESVLSAKNLRMSTLIDPAVPVSLVGDKHRLRQVLNNFVSNSIKFSRENTEINIKVVQVSRTQRTLTGNKANDFSTRNATGSSPGSFTSSPTSWSRALPPTDTGAKTGGVEPFANLADFEHSGVATVQFSVTDSGVGIAREDQGKLFQAFSQVRPGDLQMGRGSGLGLCICKHVIHLHGGKIDVNSTLGEGSTFYFNVPLLVSTVQPPPPPSKGRASEHYEEDVVARSLAAVQASSSSSTVPLRSLSTSSSSSAIPSSSSSSSSASSAAFGATEAAASLSSPLSSSSTVIKDSILVVDDVNSNRKLIRMNLGRMGFKCDEAEDGEKATEMARAKHYALILMDNVMPKMTGVEATKQIRLYDRAAGRLGTKIFGLTGNALSEDVNEFKQSGCDEVLTKPLSTPKLKEHLATHAIPIPKS